MTAVCKIVPARQRECVTSGVSVTLTPARSHLGLSARDGLGNGKPLAPMGLSSERIGYFRRDLAGRMRRHAGQQSIQQMGFHRFGHHLVNPTAAGVVGTDLLRPTGDEIKDRRLRQ